MQNTQNSGDQAAEATADAATAMSLLRELLGQVALTMGLTVRDPAARIYAFVEQGQSADVLHDLSQGEFARALFQGPSSSHGDREPGFLALLRRFYATCSALPDDVLLRWARVVAAAYSPGYAHSVAMPAPPFPAWLEGLVLHQIDGAPVAYGHAERRPGLLDYAVMCRMSVAAGFAEDAITVAAFATAVDDHRYVGHRLLVLGRMPGFDQAIVRLQPALMPIIEKASGAQLEHMLRLLLVLDANASQRFAPVLVACAGANARSIRDLAQAYVRRWPIAVVSEQLTAVLPEQTPDVRTHLLRYAWELARKQNAADIQAGFESLAASDKAASVQSLVEDWHALRHAQDPDPGPRPDPEWSAGLNPATEAALVQLAADWNEIIRAYNQSMADYHAKQAATGRHYVLQVYPEFDEAQVAALRAAIANPDPKAVTHVVKRIHDQWSRLLPALNRFAETPGLTLPALLKTIRWFNALADEHGTLTYQPIQLVAHRITKLGTPTLDQVACAMIDMGVSPRRIVHNQLTSWGGRLGGVANSGFQWPFFARYLDELLACMVSDTLSHYSINRAACYHIFQSFPHPPARLLNRVFELALGSAKTERGPAQAVLDEMPETYPRIAQALCDGKAEVRMLAAAWIARLRLTEYVGALEAAVKIEKQDQAKGAMLDALAAFGRPVAHYLDRKALARDAAKLLAKPMPAELAWLDVQAVPSVHWQDGTLVSEDVIRFFLVQSCKQKSPEPNAILRKHCELLAQEDRERLGTFVLSAWIAADTKPVSYDSAMRQARKHAQSMYRHFNDPKMQPYVANDAHRHKSEEELYAHYLMQFATVPVGSEIASKGVLALAAACGGPGIAPLAGRYLKEFYGTRAAHCKALIAMLAWVEHPSATQLMLAVGKRFRTKGIQEEANRQAQLLADRRQWSLDELADRTVPTGGVDENGLLELDYGPRQFLARLTPEFKLQLSSVEGKALSALPEARQGDDEAMVAAAKKQLAASKKEIKSTVDAQTTRLYEAMCTGRSWTLADFDQHLHQHPLLKHLVQRLVWCTADAYCQSFRPMADGSFTDCEDNAVSLNPEARIRLAHACLLAPALAKSWQQHLIDYEIKPLFAQFGRGEYVPDEVERESQEINQFKGYALEAFALRNRASKLGYSRGSAEDGGVFTSYEKRFPGLDLTCTIEFTGNELPETNRKVALLTMSFSKGAGAGPTLHLRDVPGVLLAECHHDLAMIAAEGKFDPDWHRVEGAGS